MRPGSKGLPNVECVINAVIAALLCAGGGIAGGVDRREGNAWEKIAQFFQSRAEMAGDLGA